VNVRAKRREGFAGAFHKHLECPIAPAQRAQFFDYALACASASMLAKRMNPASPSDLKMHRHSTGSGMLAPEHIDAAVEKFRGNYGTSR
jgi:hypothetical protein